MTSQQKDKIKGLFFGQAIGDALGLGSEFLNKEQVADYYPDRLTDYAQIVQDSHRERWEKGDWTDDTDQFLCVCDSILKANKVDEYAFAKELYAWAQGSPMGIGLTVHAVVSLPGFLESPYKNAELVWEVSQRELAANGAIMRTSILGAYEYWDYGKVISNSEKIAKVTHWDPRCVGSSVILSLLIAKMLNENKKLTPVQIMEVGEKYDSEIKEFVELATNPDINELYLDEEGVIGYTLKALSAGLWSYFHAKDFETGLLAIINEGGDADSNGAVAGSLLGAKFGYNCIPEKYINGLIKRDLLESKFNEFILRVEEKESVK